MWLNAGTIVNGPSGATQASISGAYQGVFVHNGKGTVDNYGTVVGGNYGDGVCLYAGGFVANGRSGATAALIAGGASGVEIKNGRGTVVNFGTIAATSTDGIGIDLTAGGTVTDAGTIRGSSGIAIYLGGTSGNRLILKPGYYLGGKVVGSASAGATNTLELGPGPGTGTVSSVIATEFVQFGAVKVDGRAHWALNSNNAILAGHTLTVAGTLTDFGTLTNAGVITGGGRLIVDPATLFNSGSIGMTVTLAGGGYLGNKTAGKIAAAGNGVIGIIAAATVVNQGHITGALGTGVRLLAGGIVTNKSSGSITGDNSGVYILGGAGSVVNYGAISETGTAGGTAIYLGAGGKVTNHGTVSAVASTGTNGSHGVYLYDGGTITNFGQISSTGTHGGAIKIAGALAGTLINSGTVTGGTAAVQLRGPGSVINGQSGVGGGLLVGYFAGIAAVTDAATFINFGKITNFGTIESTSAATSYLGLTLAAIIGGCRQHQQCRTDHRAGGRDRPHLPVGWRHHRQFRQDHRRNPEPACGCSAADASATRVRVRSPAVRAGSTF